MKSITSNLVKFAIIFALGSIVFRFGLSWFLSNHKFTEIWILAIFYFILNFSLGSFFGKRDYESLPLNDIGFSFHLTTYLIFNLISELWFLFNLNSKYENVKTFHLILVFWGIGILIHFIIYLFTRKNVIKGINKSDIFD